MTIDTGPVKPTALSWFSQNLSLNNIIAIVINIVILTVFITTISQQVTTLVKITEAMNVRIDNLQDQQNEQQLDINTVQNTLTWNSQDRKNNDAEMKEMLRELLEHNEQRSGGP